MLNTEKGAYTFYICRVIRNVRLEATIRAERYHR